MSFLPHMTFSTKRMLRLLVLCRLMAKMLLYFEFSILQAKYLLQPLKYKKRVSIETLLWSISE